MASLAERIVTLAQAIGADIKSLVVNQGSLSGLSTTAKTNLVSAINEIYAQLGNAGAQINDTAGNGATTVTWSADKIFDTIELAKTAVKNELVNGASAALDTLQELAAALNNDPNFAATIATEVANRVRYDAAQTLSAAQKTQACTNIGIGEPDTNFVTSYTTAKA
jgi:hypothetical protein